MQISKSNCRRQHFFFVCQWPDDVRDLMYCGPDGHWYYSSTVGPSCTRERKLGVRWKQVPLDGGSVMSGYYGALLDVSDSNNV